MDEESRQFKTNTIITVEDRNLSDRLHTNARSPSAVSPLQVPANVHSFAWET